MLRNIYVFSFFLIFNKLITNINCEDLSYEKKNMIQYCSKQGYNIKDRNDIFFNDICSIFYSKNKRDISLEYRRKYFYFPNYKRIIFNETLIKEIFPDIKRNNIFSCFKHHLSIKTIPFNLALYIITILFFMQMTSFFFIFKRAYIDASENSPERYYIYIKNKKNKLISKGKSINKNLKLIKENNNENKKNINFIPLKEENNLSKRNKEENIDTNVPFEEEQIHDEKKIEFKDSLSSNNLNKFESINSSNEKTQDNDKNKLFNIDEIYTFGATKIKIDQSKIQENENIISDKKKQDNIKYIYNKINNKPIKTEVKKIETKYVLLPDELFYSGFNIALLEDKRAFKQIYFSILSHCQIIFVCKQNFFIYEDIKVTILYYSIKIDLYFIFNIMLLNDVSVINKLYDNKFSLLDGFLKCLIATIIVNIISQILFIFTNSKRLFIKHINKLKNSLYNKSDMLIFFLKEIIILINNHLYLKFIILCSLNITFFGFSFFYCLCFCTTYYYTQFIVLINIFICLFISQITPFVLAFIPAYLRKKSIQKKSEKLYSFSKFINLFFIP